MKNRRILKLNLYTLLIIGILASFTYTPSDAKYYKEEESVLLYKAKFNQMGGYYIDDSSSGMGLQDNDSTASLIRYKFNFIRSEDMKSGEVDTYTLTLPDEECISTFFDGTSNVEAKSISFSTLEGMGNSIVVNLTCPVNKVINNDTINLSIKVKQQFTDEREYEYATGLFSIDATKYLENKIDKLEDKTIYLIKSNKDNIYNRFVTLLKQYIHNNETIFNEALSDYLSSATLDSLLDEYLNSIFTTGTENITVNDLERISGIILTTNTKYNILTIGEEFITQFKYYFDLKDFIIGNTIKLSKLNTEQIEQRIKSLLVLQDSNINLDELNIYIKDYLEEDKREIPSEYANIEELSYSESEDHNIITIGPNFSSYVKTYYYNDNNTTTPKNFYFFNETLSSSEINSLFYRYLDEYLYKNGTEQYNAIKNYIQNNLDVTTDNVISLAIKLDLDYFRYNSSTHAIHITSKLYDTLVNGVSYDVQKNLPVNFKVSLLRGQLEKNINDTTIIDAILNDNNFLNIVGITTGTIDEIVNIVSGTNNIAVQISSNAEEVDIHIKITITTIVNDTPIDDGISDDTVIAPPVVEPNEEDTSNESEKDENTDETVESTDPHMETDIKTQDDVGIISYPISPSTDNTLGEEKKYMFIKPEDE